MNIHNNAGDFGICVFLLEILRKLLPVNFSDDPVMLYHYHPVTERHQMRNVRAAKHYARSFPLKLQQQDLKLPS